MILLAPVEEKQIDIDAKPSDSKSAHVLKSRVKLAFCLGLEYMQAPPKRIRCDLCILGIGSAFGFSGLTSKPNAASFGTHSWSSPNFFPNKRLEK